MNERLKELYRQAHSIRHYDGDPALDCNPPTVYWQNEVSAQRFAELIVRECMTTILKESKWYWDKDEFESSNAIQNAARRVKEHFGVEE